MHTIIPVMSDPFSMSGTASVLAAELLAPRLGVGAAGGSNLTGMVVHMVGAHFSRLAWTFLMRCHGWW